MIGAFAYLIRTSTRNKLLSQLKRLRQPRYAIALLLVGGYFWLLFFTRSAREGRDQTPDVLMETFSALLPLAVLLIALYHWLFVKDRTALAFTQPEVSMLFTAPVSRRTLILYKLARNQAAVLSTTAIWVLLLNHGNRAVEHSVSYWLMLSTVNLHRLGVALVRTSQAEHGRVGWRKTWVPITLAVVLLGAVAWSFFTRRAALFGAFDASDVRRTLLTIVSSPPASWALLPFRALTAPTFARTNAAWLEALPAAIVLFLVHVVWVLRSDAAFEEAAVEASAQRAKWLASRRERSASADAIAPNRKRRTVKLSPMGTPAVAILWKNVLWLLRTGQLRAMIGLPALCAIIAVGARGRSSLAEVLVFATCAATGAMTLLFGPMTMRNDLRGELARVSILKTFPLPGREILFAEISSSALPTAVMQYLLLVVALITLGYFPRIPVGGDIRLGIALGAPLLLVGLNVANFTIHNGMALLFPAWVKTGESGVSGIETMGQSMLTVIVTVVLLALLLVFPAAGGALGYMSFRGFNTLSIVAACGAGGILLGLESYLLISALGGQLDRLEPTSVT